MEVHTLLAIDATGMVASPYDGGRRPKPTTAVRVCQHGLMSPGFATSETDSRYNEYFVLRKPLTNQINYVLLCTMRSLTQNDDYIVLRLHTK
jgi:hypothetical protein